MPMRCSIRAASRPNRSTKALLQNASWRPPVKTATADPTRSSTSGMGGDEAGLAVLRFDQRCDVPRVPDQPAARPSRRQAVVPLFRQAGACR